MNRLTNNAVYGALFAAVLTLCAWITIPTPIPVTLQTFGVYVALLLSGARRGTMAVAVYLLLGGVGVPVFSGFHGGLGSLFGPTGGYLWGLLGLCGVYALCTHRRSSLAAKLTGLLLGTLLCYGLGGGWFLWQTAADPLAVVYATAVFAAADGVKLWLAIYVKKRLGEAI